jgi:RNA polymerase sigma-70 factor (ECF subfamily)
MARGDDSDLVARLQRGDEAAFITLVDQHDAALRRTARTFVSTPASADDAVQDTWVAVLAGLASFEGRSSIKTWIFQILINRARTRGAREARWLAVSSVQDGDAADVELHRGDESTTPTQLLLRKELGAALSHAMLALPERQRAVVVLRDALGWSPEDVCSALAVNETNQRVLLHRARTRLRASLEHYRAA